MNSVISLVEIGIFLKSCMTSLLEQRLCQNLNSTAISCNTHKTNMWSNCCLTTTYSGRIKVSESILAMHVLERPPYCMVLKQHDQIGTLYQALLSSVLDVWHWILEGWDSKAQRLAFFVFLILIQNKLNTDNSKFNSGIGWYKRFNDRGSRYIIVIATKLSRKESI